MSTFSFYCWVTFEWLSLTDFKTVIYWNHFQNGYSTVNWRTLPKYNPQILPYPLSEGIISRWAQSVVQTFPGLTDWCTRHPPRMGILESLFLSPCLYASFCNVHHYVFLRLRRRYLRFFCFSVLRTQKQRRIIWPLSCHYLSVMGKSRKFTFSRGKNDKTNHTLSCYFWLPASLSYFVPITKQTGFLSFVPPKPCL